MAHHRLHSPYDRTTAQKVFALLVRSVAALYAVASSPVTYGVTVVGAFTLIAFGH